MSNWKWRLANYRLKKLAKKCNQERKAVSLQKVSHIGLLYQLKEGKMPSTIQQWQQELLSRGKSVKTLGFFNGKALPSDCIPNEKNDFFCRRDLNLLGIVKEVQIQAFLSQPFELLIHAYTEPHPALLGVSVYSKARLRVGPHFKEFTDCFDLMLEPQKASDLESLVEEMKIRLEGIV